MLRAKIYLFFFQQWLYKAGTLKYSGNWQYDSKGSQVRITLDQVQNDGSLFKMPLEIGIYFAGQDRPQIELVQVNERSNVFTINVDAEPGNIILDPNTWLLMEVDFKKNE